MQSEIFDVLRGLLDHVDRNTCTHESTHRGGFIWTICDDCGMKWADDKGGFKPHADAPAVAKARAALDAALSEKQAVEVKADRGDLLSLIKWAHETLYEINPSNYDHDEVCKLNDASVEVILGLAQALGERHGYSADWWEKYRTDHPLPALVDVPAVEPVAGYRRRLPQYAFEHYEFEQPGYENPSISDWEPLYTSPPLSHREGEDSAEVERLTRPIVGIEHRTAQEVFDIMADRIRLAATRSGSATTASGTGGGE